MKTTSKATSGPAKDPLKEVRLYGLDYQCVPTPGCLARMADRIGSRIRRL